MEKENLQKQNFGGSTLKDIFVINLSTYFRTIQHFKIMLILRNKMTCNTNYVTK